MFNININEMNFSFLYGGKPFADFDAAKSITKNGNVTTVIYSLSDGLTVTHTVTAYPDYNAYEWVTAFENNGDKPTEILSEMWDCDAVFRFDYDDELGYTAYMPDKSRGIEVHSPSGSFWGDTEFYNDVDKISVGRYINRLYPGGSMRYSCEGGRSSDGERAPFFNLHQRGKGIIFAIGWTGQWNCEISRANEEVSVKTKIEDTHFRLMPGEKIRTSSFVVMSYSGDFADSQNKWRRLVKEHFSPIGKGECRNTLPFCAGIWGGMADKEIFDRLRVINENQLPFEYIWMDAGWYGGNEVDATPDEFEGDWAVHTGDWRINNAHPGGLEDVAAAVRDSGMEFLLWFEPERVRRGTPISLEHPEYFIEVTDREDTDKDNLLLNLGNEDAWRYCFDFISKKIERLGISCYRQDFNFSPISYWRANDSEDRRGITEIKHILGLYRLWDALREKFPYLIIDNCASGGRRIDIETMRRAVPLWRSDMACPANYPSNYNQIHNVTFGTWIPYSGTGTGREYDMYRIRSAYAGGLTTNYTFSARNKFGNDADDINLLKKAADEYKHVRPYFYADIYPLTKITSADDTWHAVQYNRPENNDGIIQIFRRENACGTSACYKLRGLDTDGNYLFTDADSGETIEAKGKKLAETGIDITIKSARTAKLYFYKKRE